MVAWDWGNVGTYFKGDFRNFFGNDENVLSLDCGNGYMSIHSCQNSLNHTLKMGVFIVHKLYPCKFYLKKLSCRKDFIKGKVHKILSEKFTKQYLQYIYFHVCCMHKEEIKRKYTKITTVVITEWWKLWVI